MFAFSSLHANVRRSPCELCVCIALVWCGLTVFEPTLVLADEDPAVEAAHKELVHMRDAPAREVSSRLYWSEQFPRPFAAVVLDMGTSIRGRAQLGLGQPHWIWGGFELEAASTSDMGLLAARARVALVVADIGLAYRRTWGYRRTWLEREPGYTESDLRGRPRTSYQSLDLDVWGLIPAGSGFVQWEVEAVRLYGAERGYDVYEEWLRAPVRPPWVTDTRLAYAYTFLRDRAAVGVMAEWLWLGGRGQLYRVGPLLMYTFTPHWEATVLLTTPVHSPDDLNFFSGLYGTIRVRWKFATDERRTILR
jgi:hypothetical protein